MEIRAKNLIKKYRDKEILHNISFSISFNQGGVIGLIGPNGAGKSTILRVLSGVLLPNSGSISFSSESTLGKKDGSIWIKDNVFFVPVGDRGLRSALTIFENLKYFTALRGGNLKENKKRFNHYLEIFKAEQLKNTIFENMSTGQKKKACILVAISLNPKLLLLDEPSNGLDIDAQLELMTLVKELTDIHGITTIISSHDTHLISNIADAYLFIKKGNVAEVVKQSLNEKDLIEKYHELFGETK